MSFKSVYVAFKVLHSPGMHEGRIVAGVFIAPLIPVCAQPFKIIVIVTVADAPVGVEIQPESDVLTFKILNIVV